MLMITGGAGFIGANFVLHRLANHDEAVLNLDLLTYAGHLASLAPVADTPRHCFVRGDIADVALVARLLQAHRPRAIVHLAAESHVDRSIFGPEAFIHTNVVGTSRLLQAVLDHWRGLPGHEQDAFRFVHVSTDEVYGSLGPTDPPSTEGSAYAPNSPYSASKAAADHLVRAYHQTHGLPTITIHCTNNYGPRQFPEKLIPLLIHRALRGEPLPLYGDGLQIRDWLHVEDHCQALDAVLAHGRPGEVYNVGGREQQTNLAVAHAVCATLDEIRPRADARSYATQITRVQDRPGHDRRYALDIGKIAGELGWQPRRNFAQGLRQTIEWYLANAAWVRSVTAATPHLSVTHQPRRRHG